jgi:hypothetical protein
MKKLLALAIGVFLSGSLLATVNAGPNDDVTQPKEKSQSTTEPAQLSKRNKAKLEQAEQARLRREEIRSKATGTGTK